MQTLALIQAAPQGGGMGMAMIIQIVLIVAIFYFVFILPQRRQQKQHQAMLADLKPGDTIVTSGGVFGDIIQLRDDYVTLKTGESRIVVERARIAKRIVDTDG